MVCTQYTHVGLVCFVHTHYTHVRLVCFVHAQYTQIRPVCVVHTHYTHVRLVCIIHTHYTQARRVCIVYTHYAHVRLVCIVHLTRHPHLQCVTRPRCAIVCCSVESVAELVYTYRHKLVRYGFHLLLWVLCKRATFLWGSFANKPYKRAWLCCGFCATWQGSLDWFEVDLRARPSFFFRVICVLSILIRFWRDMPIRKQQFQDSPQMHTLH